MIESTTRPAPDVELAADELLRRLHEESDAQSIRRARAQFRGTDVEFRALAEDYETLAPRLKGRFLARYGLSSEDIEASQGTDLSLAVSNGMGQFLHHQLLALRPDRVLEIGSSYGVSTLHLAAAMRQLGRGTVVATEVDAAKCAKLREHLRMAGLAAFVDLREGDVFETLDTLDGSFGMIFMDVWSSAYLEVFKRIERLLQPGSVVITDNMYTAELEVRPYKAYLDTNPRYSSMTMDFGSGVEFTAAL